MTETQTLTAEELRDILAAHAKWLAGDKSGKRADLSSLDCRHMDFSGADLRKAKLINGDYSFADFSGADMTGAIMSFSDFYCADFSHAVLDNVLCKWGDFNGTIWESVSTKGAEFLD